MKAEVKQISLKIIVVDDSELSRSSISKILSDNGYSVVGLASNPKEALMLLGNNECNLMIIDVVMPKSSGIELVKTLNDQNLNFKYIMISSLDLENVIIESISNGVLDYLQKPFSSKELLGAVQRAEKMMNDET